MYLQAGWWGGQGLYGTRRGGAEREGICTQRGSPSQHTPSFYKAACWVSVLFVFAKTVILNKCRLFFFRLCSASAQGKAWGVRGGGLLRGMGRAVPGFHLGAVRSSVPSKFFAPAGWGFGAGRGCGGSTLLMGKINAHSRSLRTRFPRWPRRDCVLRTKHKVSWDEPRKRRREK